MKIAKIKPRIYVDSSLLLRIILGQRKSEFKESDDLCSSTLTLVECERNLIRLSREKHLSSEDFDSCRTLLEEYPKVFLLKDLSLDLCLTTEFPNVRTPKSLDLVHLRTALWFQRNGGLYAFYSCDEHQRRAAIELGLNAPNLR